MPLGDAPERFLTMYPPEQVQLRQNVPLPPPVDEEWFKIYLWDYVYYHYREPHTLELPEGFDLRAMTALYWGSVACEWQAC